MALSIDLWVPGGRSEACTFKKEAPGFETFEAQAVMSQREARGDTTNASMHTFNTLCDLWLMVKCMARLWSKRVNCQSSRGQNLTLLSLVTQKTAAKKKHGKTT